MLSLLVVLLGTAAADQLVIPPGHDQQILRVVEPYKLGGPVAAGFTLGDVNIGRSRVDFNLVPPGKKGRTLHVELKLDGKRLLGRYRYTLRERPPDSQLTQPERQAVAALKRSIKAHANDAFWSGVTEWRAGAAAHAGSAPVFISGTPPPYSLVCFFGLLVLVLGGALIARRRSGAVSARTLIGEWRAWTAVVLVAAVAALLPLAHWYVAMPSGAHLRVGWWRVLHERALASVAMWTAAGALAITGLGTLVRVLLRRPSRAAWVVTARFLLDAGCVLAWSVFVRFGLTSLNILTDGGTGYRRIQQYTPSFGGLSLLVHALLPHESRFMWSALHVTAVLAALGPPMLYVAARTLGFERRTALFAGAALASLPLHAAMFTSDFLVGALVSLQLLGVALVAGALDYDRPELIVGGAALLAYTTWARPDAPMIGGLLLYVCWRALRQWRQRPVLIGGLAWFGLNVLAVQMAARAAGTASHLHWSLFARLEPLVRFLPLQAVIPWWLWLPAPLGAWALWRRERSRAVLVAIGLAAGVLPLSLGPGGTDLTHSHMELFRYGTWALPWLVLCAARGLDEAARWLSARWAARRGSSSTAVELVPSVLVIACLAATPLYERAYLARIYGPRAEEAVFHEVLRKVPPRCGLVVPDDVSDVVAAGHGTIEILARYVYITQEAAERGQKVIPSDAIVGVTQFLKLLGQGHALPFVPRPRGADSKPNRCWYLFHGSYCDTGIDGHPTAVCSTVERRLQLEPVLTRRIRYISHRFVTRPDLRSPPLYDPAERLTLWRVTGLRHRAPH